MGRKRRTASTGAIGPPNVWSATRRARWARRTQAPHEPVRLVQQLGQLVVGDPAETDEHQLRERSWWGVQKYVSGSEPARTSRASVFTVTVLSSHIRAIGVRANHAGDPSSAARSHRQRQADLSHVVLCCHVLTMPMRHGYVHPWLGSRNAHRRGSPAALTDDDSGRLVASADGVDVALGGAMLIELTLLGRVDVAGPGESVRKGRLLVKDVGPTPDPLLDEALALLVKAGQEAGRRRERTREGHAPTAVRQADRPGFAPRRERKGPRHLPEPAVADRGRRARGVGADAARPCSPGRRDRQLPRVLLVSCSTLNVVQKVGSDNGQPGCPEGDEGEQEAGPPRRLGPSGTRPSTR